MTIVLNLNYLHRLPLTVNNYSGRCIMYQHKEYPRAVGQLIAPIKTLVPTQHHIRADLYDTLQALPTEIDQMTFVFRTLTCAAFSIGEIWGLDLAIKEVDRLKIELEAVRDASLPALHR